MSESATRPPAKDQHQIEGQEQLQITMDRQEEEQQIQEEKLHLPQEQLPITVDHEQQQQIQKEQILITTHQEQQQIQQLEKLHLAQQQLPITIDQDQDQEHEQQQIQEQQKLHLPQEQLLIPTDQEKKQPQEEEQDELLSLIAPEEQFPIDWPEWPEVREQEQEQDLLSTWPPPLEQPCQPPSSSSPVPDIPLASPPAATQCLDLPGVRFVPSDIELIVDYLQPKLLGEPLPTDYVHVCDVYSDHPKVLTSKLGHCIEGNWYMFSPRSRKYTYGKRPSRSTSHVGFWKSTSKNEPVLETQDDGTTKVIGYKGCLTYHELDEKNATMAVKPTAGRELKKLSKKDIAIKTPWKMWEFVCSNSNRPCDVGEDPMRLNDWVLCKVTNKEMCQGASKKTQPVNKKQKLRGVVIKQPLESSWASSSQDTVVQQETPNSSLVVAGGDAAAAVTAVPTPLQMVPPYRSSLHYNTNDSLVIAGGDAAAAEDPLVLQTVPPYAPSLHYNTNGSLVVSRGDASVVKDRMPLQMVSLYAPSLHHNTNGSLVVVRGNTAVAAMAEDPMPLQMVSPYAPSLHYNTNGFVVDYSTEVAQNSIVVDYNIGVDASYITSDSPVTTANGFVDLQNDSLNYQ